MKKPTTTLLLIFLLALSCQESNPPKSDDQPLLKEVHERNIKVLIDFFDQNAYQAEKGVYLSEIDNQGKRLSYKVFNVALSRLIYGLSYASIINEDYLTKAEKAGQFQLNYLTGMDTTGGHFLSFHDIQTEESDTSSTLDIWQQAYGLCGLSELYRHNQDKALLSQIHKYHDGFISRFHDKTHGGFYGEYHLKNGQVSGTKSLQSLMYPITAYMENLWRADTANRSKYEVHLKENVKIAAEHAWNKELAWVNIKMDDEWNPCPHESAESPCFKVSPGHNFQFASLLLRTKDWDFLSEAERTAYRDMGLAILKETLAKPIFPNEQLSQGFYSEVNPMNNAITDDRKTWWQHCEALIAMSLPGEMYTNKIAVLEKFFFDHFPDKVNGGEYFFLDSSNGPQTEVPKGSIGKSIYHTVEMIRFLNNSSADK